MNLCLYSLYDFGGTVCIDIALKKKLCLHIFAREGFQRSFFIVITIFAHKIQIEPANPQTINCASFRKKALIIHYYFIFSMICHPMVEYTFRVLHMNEMSMYIENEIRSI